MSHVVGSAKSLFRRFYAEQIGATATEYAFGLALLILVAITALSLLGNQLGSMTTSISTDLSTSTSEAAGSFGPGDFRLQTNVNVP